MSWPLVSRIPDLAKLPNREGFHLSTLVDRYGEALYLGHFREAADLARDIVIVATRTYNATVRLARTRQTPILLPQEHKQVDDVDYRSDKIKAQKC